MTIALHVELGAPDQVQYLMDSFGANAGCKLGDGIAKAFDILTEDAGAKGGLILLQLASDDVYKMALLYGAQNYLRHKKAGASIDIDDSDSAEKVIFKIRRDGDLRILCIAHGIRADLKDVLRAMIKKQ